MAVSPGREGREGRYDGGLVTREGGRERGEVFKREVRWWPFIQAGRGREGERVEVFKRGGKMVALHPSREGERGREGGGLQERR